jgi:hypothetical protein
MNRTVGIGLAVMGIGLAARAGDGNLLENGSFDDPADPMTGWASDYAWTGNRFDTDNYRRVNVVPREGARTTVLHVDGRGTQDAGIKAESAFVPVEPGARYRCTLRVKGGPARIYLKGYAWKPGVRPNDNPQPGRLRPVYKSEAYAGSPRAWTPVTLDFPKEGLSDAGKKHIAALRYLTVYVWSNGDVYIDDVVLKRR